MADKIFSTFEKADHEQIRVLLSTYKGTESLHIRSFWNTETDPEWKFGKGVTIPTDELDGLNSIIDGLQKARESLEK